MAQQDNTAAHHEQRDTRATFPLVRELDAEAPDRTIEIDFELPPQVSDPEPPIFIGVRLGGADPAAVAAAADRLQDADIRAQVRLYRLGGAAPVAVALSRSQWVDRSEVQTVPVGDDGHVPGLFATSADVASMREAGLLPQDVAYKELKFVFIRDTPPGRYRAVIRLDDPRRALRAENAELLIAYTARSK